MELHAQIPAPEACGEHPRQMSATPQSAHIARFPLITVPALIPNPRYFILNFHTPFFPGSYRIFPSFFLFFCCLYMSSFPVKQPFVLSIFTCRFLSYLSPPMQIARKYIFPIPALCSTLVQASIVLPVV